VAPPSAGGRWRHLFRFRFANLVSVVRTTSPGPRQAAPADQEEEEEEEDEVEEECPLDVFDSEFSSSLSPSSSKFNGWRVYFLFSGGITSR